MIPHVLPDLTIHYLCDCTNRCHLWAIKSTCEKMKKTNKCQLNQTSQTTFILRLEMKENSLYVKSFCQNFCSVWASNVNKCYSNPVYGKPTFALKF